MHFTPAIALVILAFTATTTTADSYGHDNLVARSPYEYESLYESDGLVTRSPYDYDSLYERDATADADPIDLHLPNLGHHHPSIKPPSTGALKRATDFLKKLQSGTLQIANSDVGQLLGAACDVNTIASIFDGGSSIGSAVSNGVTVACTAGQIVQVAAGAKHKRWATYKRAAAAEADARAEAEAWEEHGMRLAARWAEGLGY
ncbi:hypothetical protein MMC15_008380 [Xylographa vitiligo]|nr:hypothetical protein [Xylographa vitiligo]